MSVLIVLIPARPRLTARGAGAAATAPADEFEYVLSADGRQPGAQGRAGVADLPAAGSMVAVLADADVGWQRVQLPRAPAARMRQALQGVLEDDRLDDDNAVHYALPPQPQIGQPDWVAVVNRPWLAAELARLERGGRSVDRVVPALTPGEPPRGHFMQAATADVPNVQLSIADADGHAVLGLAGSLARENWLGERAALVHWSASPAAAGAAEQWLGRPVDVIGDAERALQAAQSRWNLRQFDLALRHRGALAWREARREFLSPAWRPVRFGLLALLGAHLLGINAWAWQQRRAMADKREEMVELLRTTHPEVRAVLDAPLQMTRANDALRMSTGRPGEADFETLLAVAASAWPDDAQPLQGLRFENGQLSFPSTDWQPAQVEEFRRRLAAAGWSAQSADGTLTLARAGQARP